MKPRLYLPLGVLLLHPGCAFFGVERSDCFPDLDCPVTGGDGDGDLPGDGDIVGDGDGDVPGSGGIGVGDGDGDGDENIYPSTGGGGDGDGDGDLMGGAPPVGGGDGSGGTSGGGSGGAPTGGSGGMADGGTGGGAVGGSGGDSTGGASAGGSGGDGSGGADPGVFTVLINEIYTQYVEVFLFQSSGVPVALDDFRIVVNSEEQNACVLTGAVVDSSNPFHYAQKPPQPCFQGTNCTGGCSFDTIGVSMEVRLEQRINGAYEVVDTQMSASTALSPGESYQRRPDDGTGDFQKAAYTPGSTNNPE
jgi:hypothetical protein